MLINTRPPPPPFLPHFPSTPNCKSKRNSAVAAKGVASTIREIKMIRLGDTEPLHERMPRVLRQRDESGDSVLDYAVTGSNAVGSHAVASRLLKEGCAHLEDKDDYGWTPLLWAAYCGHFDVVKLLLGHGANILAEDDFGRNIFHLIALTAGNIGSLKEIIHKYSDSRKTRPDRGGGCGAGGGGARHRGTPTVGNPNAHIACSWYDTQDKQGRTPLHWASIRGLDALVLAYVKRGADCSIVDNDHRPAIHYACMLSPPNATLLHALVCKPRHRAARVAQAAHFAATARSKGGSPQTIVSKYKEVAMTRKARLSCAAEGHEHHGDRNRRHGDNKLKQTHTRRRDILLAGGKGGSNGLMLASSLGAAAGLGGFWGGIVPDPGGNTDRVFQADASGRTPLHYAANFGNISWILKFLNVLHEPKRQIHELQHPDANGWMPLHYAAHSGHAKALGIMLGYDETCRLPSLNGQNVPTRIAAANIITRCSGASVGRHHLGATLVLV